MLLSQKMATIVIPTSNVSIAGGEFLYHASMIKILILLSIYETKREELT